LARALYRDDRSSIDFANFLLRRGRPDRALAAIEEALPDVAPMTGMLMLGSAVCVALRSGDEAGALGYLSRAESALAASGATDVSLADLFAQLGEPRALALIDRRIRPAGVPGLRLAQGLLGGAPDSA
jgi:Tfp pilus assembly protein PilF